MKKYRVYEDNGGGLYLAFYSDKGELETLHGNYEYRTGPGSITTDIKAVEDDPDVNLFWDNNELNSNPDSDYSGFEARYEPVGLTIIADNDGIYPERMGCAGRIEFGIKLGKEPFNETTYKNEWTKANKDRVNLIVPKGTKERIRQAAAPDSVNSFILKAIEDKIKKDPEP